MGEDIDEESVEAAPAVGTSEALDTQYPDFRGEVPETDSVAEPVDKEKSEEPIEEEKKSKGLGCFAKDKRAAKRDEVAASGADGGKSKLQIERSSLQIKLEVRREITDS